MSTGYAVLRWAARDAPTVFRPDGKADTVAHHVLLCLCLYAGKDATARPGVETLAGDARLTSRATVAALGRLEAAGLIARAGELTGGTVVWVLRTGLRRGEEEALAATERRERARRQHAERSRRYRTRLSERDAEPERHAESVGDAEVERDVTPNLSVTNGSVTPNLDARDAEPRRTRRSTSTHVTPSRASQPQVTPATRAIELPMNCHRTKTTRERASDTNDDVTPLRDEEFDRFWAAYPRKDAKPAARKAFAKAAKRHGAAALTAHAERWARLWQAARREKQFIPHPATWLNGERWEDEPPLAQPPSTNGVRVNGHQPYSNPSDQSVYDEPL